MSTTKKTILLQQGDAFNHSFEGKFAKDVVVDGAWKDTKSGRVVTFTPERRARLMQETNRFLSNGNKIPFPDGHSWDANRNMGYWPGPFVNLGTRLVGVVEPRGDDVKKKIKDRKIDAVSVVIEYDHEDPKGNVYPEVITQICATPVPVLTDQKDFVELSRVEGLEEILVAGGVVAPPKEEIRLEPSFEELAQGFQIPPLPSFDSLAQGFLEMSGEK